MKKQKKPNIFVRWYRLCEPNKHIWFWQIMFYVGYTVFLTLLTIFAARTINCMYNADWSGAFLNLGLELMTIVVRSVCMHIQYKFYGMHLTHIRMNVAKKIYRKLLSCENAEIKNITKEKIINIATNNLSNLSEFPDAVASFIAYSIQVVIVLVTVFIANYWAGLIVSALGVVNFFAYYKFNKKMGKILLTRNQIKDKLYSSYDKIIEGKAVINEFAGQEQYEGELLENVHYHAKEYSKYYLIQSWKNNMYYAAWNVVVYAITALLLFFVSKGSLDISIYLIVVPYLTTCTDKLNTMFDKTNSVENMRVDVDRVNLILNLTDKQLIKYGQFNTKADGYNLGFIDVSYQNDDPSSDNFGKLSGVDISFKMTGVNVIKGERGSGKRLIFNMLRREIQPNKGKILLDNLDLYMYNQKTYKNHIYYCASHPAFIKGTIKENLSLMTKNFKNIKDACQRVGALDYIEKLPQGFESQISEIKSSTALFLIGLARAILSDCNVLMIYELPQDAAKSLKNNIKNFVTTRGPSKTIILFTHDDEYDDIADLTYQVKDGKVKFVRPAKPVNEVIEVKAKEIKSAKPAKPAKEAGSAKPIKSAKPSLKIKK